MDTYRTSMSLKDVRFGDLDEIVEIIAERGSYAIDTNNHLLYIDFRVGSDHADCSAVDLWDLRDVAAELEQLLSNYTSFPIELSKPSKL